MTFNPSAETSCSDNARMSASAFENPNMICLK
jgi:serine/threonine protein kinase